MAKKSGRPPRSRTDILSMQYKIAQTALGLFRQEGFEAVSIRRLAKEVGCAPMTIYAHFDSKTDILRHLWGDVLDGLFAEISQQLTPLTDPAERLQIAARIFVTYWLENPDHFRLVFMSGDVTRADVNTFIQEGNTQDYFGFFRGLVQNMSPEGTDVKAKTDMLVASMIGIALCINTIGDYPWESAQGMTDALLDTIQ